MPMLQRRPVMQSIIHSPTVAFIRFATHPFVPSIFIRLVPRTSPECQAVLVTVQTTSSLLHHLLSISLIEWNTMPTRYTYTPALTGMSHHQKHGNIRESKSLHCRLVRCKSRALCMLALRLQESQAAKLLLSSQDKLEPVSVPSTWAYLLKYRMRSGPPWELVRPGPHSMPPLMMFVTVPKPSLRPAAESAADGCHLPVMTSWHEGLAPADVILRMSIEVKVLLASPMTAGDGDMH